MIDLKKTLDESGKKQAEIVQNFKIPKQQVSQWYNGQNIGKGWDFALKQYFSGCGNAIYEK